MRSEERDQENCDNYSLLHYHDRRKKGDWTAVKYILANETFEKLASMSLIANITVYLRTKYNMDGILLVNVVNMWSGTCNFLTLAGALLSDAYLGRFCTLLLGSVFSMLGMGTMTLGAGVPKLRPQGCNPESKCMKPTSWQLAVLFIALLLLAMGAGCIRPCNIAFGADQFDTRTEKGRSQLSRFYNWWYFSFTISLLVALTTVVYIQTNISWTIGFAIPTLCFAFSIIIFLLGYPSYIFKHPQGSIYVDMVKVMVAAYRKRKVNLDETENNVTTSMNNSFYNPPIVDDQLDNLVSTLSRSNRLRFLDKASLITDSDEVNREGVAIDSWKLCTVKQVEQLKSLIGILPVWLAGVLCFVSIDQQNTFGMLQAIQMDRKMGSKFVIPPAWIWFASMVSLSMWIFSYERVVLSLMRKIMKKDDVRLSMTVRIKIGIVMSILSMAIGAMVESKRRKVALKSSSFVSPLNVGFLVPQLILSGLTEAFAAVTIMEFFTTQMSEYMRSMAGSIFFISLAMASYLATAIVNIMYRLTRRNDGMAWLGGHDLNKNRLDCFYAIVACIGVANFFYFSLFASKFVFIENNNRDSEAPSSSSSLNSSLDPHTQRRSEGSWDVVQTSSTFY